MSSLEKRHKSRRGSLQGHHKHSDGFSDTSSMGSFMDETDREVSNLTDRAFRSLCIGEEAIYNDSEISSPTERHKAFAEEVQQKEVLKNTGQETLSYGIQYGAAERKPEVTSTFQHSYVDVAQEQVLRDEHMSYMSNGSIEAAWQHRRSTSRVSSLIKAFSSREGYCDNGTPDAVLLRDKYIDYNNGSWDKSTLLSIQRELSEISTHHQNFKPGPFQSYRNNFHASAAAMARMDTTPSIMKSKFQALNSTNFFFHSEFSPFQLWEDYNRFPFEREEPLGLVLATDFPRWYDSPLYKELTTTNAFSCESRSFNRRKIEDVVPTQRSRSTVIQKASSIEKRCESEMTLNCPPWKRNNHFVRSKLPCNRPSTVSPTNETTHRPNSSLLLHNRHVYDIQHRVESIGDNRVSTSSTPFNITQLLTPVIHGRQETETSEILQFAHTPSLPDYSGQVDVDLKPLADVRQLRDSYKSKASSLLFNLKDNRKRVKSTYSPTKFKSLEISNRDKQPSILEDLESRLSDMSASHVTTQEHSTDAWEAGEVVQQTYEDSLSQTVQHQRYADGSHEDITLASCYGAGSYKMSYGGSQGNSLHQDGEEYDFSVQLSSAHNSAGNSEGHIYGLRKKPSPTRPGIENTFTKANTQLHPPAHSLTAQISEKQTFNRRNVGHHDRQIVDAHYGNTTNLLTEENLSWQNREPLNITNKEMFNNNGNKDSLTVKGDIAALIELDKQSKATAKQYVPSPNSSYSTGTETYINKVNEDIKQGRLLKEEDGRDTDGFSQKFPFAHKPTRGNPANAQMYEFQNTFQSMTRMTSPSPSKESSFTGHNKVQRNVKYAPSNITAEQDHCQKIQSSISLEERHQKNEGSVAYQPYKYEPSKQWHIAATENRHIIDDVNISIQQQQTEKKSEHPAETHYAHPVLEIPDIPQKSTAYTTRTTQRNLITEESAKTGEGKPSDSMAPKLTYQTKHGDMQADINKLSTEPNNNNSQGREEKFSINDILSIRDNEQAKRIKENKHSLTANVSDPIKLDNQAFPVASDLAVEQTSKIDAAKINEPQATQNPSSLYKHENLSHGYLRKQSYFQNEGLVNIGTTIKDKSGKEALPNKENDRITPKPLSYKERGQTKQEILTSKLKAHAQKEISAIKEKGLAKQAVLSRNPGKQNAAVNSTKGQMSQDVLSPRKEITAEKLNHLFQDITYSSVTLYKEHRNQDRDGPQYEPYTTEEMTLSKRASGPQADVVHSEKNNEALKDDKITTNEKERTQVQPLSQRTQAQDEKVSGGDKKTSELKNEYSKSITEHQKKLSVHETIDGEPVPAKHLTNSPAEALSIKTEEQPSSLPTKYGANLTEHPKVTSKGKESPKWVGFGNVTPCSLTSNLEQVKSLGHSVNKAEEQPSNAKADETTAKSVQTDPKCTDLAETTKAPLENPHHESQNKAQREKLKEASNENKFDISASQVKSPSEWAWLKDKAPPVESALGYSDNKSALPTNYKANSPKDREWLTSEANFSGTNESPVLVKVKTLDAKEKENLELCAKQDVKVQIERTSKTTEDYSTQQLQHVDTPKVKDYENASRNKGNQTSYSGEEDKTNTIFAKVKGRCLQEEQNTEDRPQNEKDETPQISHSKQKLRGSKYPNSSIVKTGEAKGSNDHQLQQDSDRSPDDGNQIQKEKDVSEHEESAFKEMKQAKDKCTVNKNDLKSTGSESEKSSETSYSIHAPINNTHEQMKSQTAQEKGSEIINPGAESKIIHIPSKEDNTPADEPVIYSICVSSKSDVASEEEPVIFTICVSSISESSMTDGPANQDTQHCFVGKQLSTEGAQKEGETSGNKNEETEKVHLESKASDSEETKASFSSDKAEIEPAIRKDDLTATKDKHDYYRSSEVKNISSSYESLLAKYGLVHRKSDQKQQNEKQEKEMEDSTNKLSDKLPKNSNDDSSSADTISAPEEVPELLKRGEEHEQCITHLMKTNGGLTQEVAGILIHSDNKQLRLQNEQDISEKQTSSVKVSNSMTNCEDSRDAQATTASKQNTRNSSIELNGKKQVVPKVKAIDFAGDVRQKEKENESLVHKQSDTILVENKINSKLSSTNNSKSPTKVGNQPYEHISKNSISVNDILSKVSKPVAKTIAQNNASDRGIIPRQDITHLYKFNPDIPVVQHQKAISENIKTKDPKLENRTKDECEQIKPEMQSKGQVLTKDNKALQNIKKDLVWKNELSGREQVKLKRSNETKDRVETARSNEQRTGKENENGSKALDTNASDSIKLNQGLSKASNIPLDNAKENKDKHNLNKDVSAVQDRMIDQQKHIKADSESARDVVLPKNANSQSITGQKVAGQKLLTVINPTEGDSEGIQKWKGELVPRQRENVKDEITPGNKENATKAYLVEVEKCTEGKSNMNNRVKEGTAQPQVKKEDTLTVDKARKDSGQTKGNVGSLKTVVKENSHGIREKMGNTGEGSQVRYDERFNVYQYHPGKGFLPETKANTGNEQSSIGTSHHGMEPKKNVAASTKSEVVQKEKKTTRPDISALADYARLRVICAEDENTIEKDLLQKMDTHRKYTLSSVQPQKSVQENRSTPGAEAKKELTVTKSNENQSQTAKPLQDHEGVRRPFQRHRITEGIREGQNQFISREETVSHPKVQKAESSDERVAVKETGRTKEHPLTNQMQPSNKLSLTEHHSGYQRSNETHQSPAAQGKNDYPVRIRQPVHDKLLEKYTPPYVKNQQFQQQTSGGSLHNEATEQEDNKINTASVEVNDAEKVEELEYYTVSTVESKPKSKDMHEALPSSDTFTSKKEVPETETTRPRSTTSSPAMGKPTMFRVKDNTTRTLSVTKAVKPRFHRSFSEELKVSSQKEMCSGLEKGDHNLEHQPKESANPPVLREQEVASHRLPRAREIQSQNSLSSAEFTAAKDPRSYHRRSKGFEDDEAQSVISTVSEDVERFAESSVVMKDSIPSHEFKSSRSTSARPESACYERPESSCYERPESSCYERPESSCYERPESSCYERPESACSDIRSMGKPPTVPPKSEKALRRAQKLTTRRIKKAETKTTSDSQGQLETKPIRAFSSLPSSPMELISTHHAAQASPPIPHYRVEPNYVGPPSSLVAHPFPVTQRKLLQDPNSGQYFMVDMPVQVKTKMFFDPETGKYVQLNVRQRTPSTLSQPQPVELLNQSYVMYPGFLPMPVSTLPSLRSSSQMSAPATLVEEQHKLAASREPGRQETYRLNCHNNNNAVYRSHEQEQSACEKFTPRHTDIIIMSELEDFAVEST